MITTTSPGTVQPQISTPFQPGGAQDRIGTREQEPQTNEPQPAQASAADTQESINTRADEPRVVARAENDSDERTPAEFENAPRGSVVNIQA